MAITNSSFIFMMKNEQEYLLNKLFLSNKILYAVVNIFLFSVVSGIFAIINFVIVTLPFFKYKIFAFFPM